MTTIFTANAPAGLIGFVGYQERETFDAFLKLPAPQRKLIREVILTFAKVHSDVKTIELD